MSAVEPCGACGALPCDWTTEPKRNPLARDFIAWVAAVSEQVAWQAGVGGMETAGAILSYLAEHPEDLEPFMNGGWDELPALMHQHGRLTWHGMNGKIVSPEFARRARVIKGLEKSA